MAHEARPQRPRIEHELLNILHAARRQDLAEELDENGYLAPLNEEDAQPIIDAAPRTGKAADRLRRLLRLLLTCGMSSKELEELTDTELATIPDENLRAIMPATEGEYERCPLPASSHPCMGPEEAEESEG